MIVSEITYQIEAIVSMYPEELNGRKLAVQSGYRPNLKFNSVNRYFCGEWELLNKDLINPGTSGKVLINMLPAKYIPRNLKVNDAFIISEGKKVVGSGYIVYVNKQEGQSSKKILV